MNGRTQLVHGQDIDGLGWPRDGKSPGTRRVSRRILYIMMSVDKRGVNIFWDSRLRGGEIPITSCFRFTDPLVLEERYEIKRTIAPN